jgi:hypothetical protein
MNDRGAVDGHATSLGGVLVSRRRR